jgi:HEPN domain-containing protein
MGHGIGSLLRMLTDRTPIPQEIMKAAKKLDSFYIPTRYPNGMDQGAPTDFFDQEDADGAVSSAGEVIGFCENILAR